MHRPGPVLGLVFSRHSQVRPITIPALWAGVLRFAAYQVAVHPGGLTRFRATMFDLAVALIADRLGHPDRFTPLGDQTVGYRVFCSAASVAIAAVSWPWFEGPINDFRHRLDARARARL